MRAAERAAEEAAVGLAPDRASDPHGAPTITSGEIAAIERGPEPLAPAPPPPASPMAGDQPTPTTPRGPSPISDETPARESSTFRTRTESLARLAELTVHRRRAILAALLGVALLSASIGVLTGRWLASRTAVEVRGER